MTIGRIPSVEGGIQPTIVDAKGDLIVATAADTVARLAVGTNDYVLTAASGETTGLKWAAGGLPSATSYTPATTNWTLGNGTMTTYYISSGDTVFYYGRILLGSTSSVTGAMRIGLPFNSGITATATYANSSSGYFYDASSGVIYQMVLSGPSTSTLGFNVWKADGTYVNGWDNINASTPVAPASGDEFQFYVWYRKA